MKLSALMLPLLVAPLIAQTPVLDCDFETVADRQHFIDHAPGEGPSLLPGPFGRCLDLTASSRAGGQGEQPEAGGSVAITDAQLDSLSEFTVVLWLQPTETRSFAARILNKDGSWELMHGGSALALYLTGPGGKTHYGSDPIHRRETGSWVFFAGTIGGGQVTTRIGTVAGGLTEPVVKPLAEPLTTLAGPLEIGNYHGIRPFQGRLDRLRVFQGALRSEQIAKLFADDCAQMHAGGPFEALAAASEPPARFDLPRSTVPFSSRWQRKSEEVAGLLKAYGATHLLWVYGDQPDYVAAMHQVAPFYEGTLNGMQGYQDSPAATTGDDLTGRQRGLDDQFLQMGHMVAWNPERPQWQGCQNHPDFRKLFFAAADGLLTAGVDGIHVDDWELNLTNVQAGRGCFCEGCLAGFRQYLQQHLPPDEAKELGVGDLATFDYRTYLKAHDLVTDSEDYRKRFRELPLTPYFLDYQAAGLRDFYLAFRAHLAQQSPNKLIPVSVNNQFGRYTADGGLRGAETVDSIDFYIGEASVTKQDLVDFVMPIRTAAALGMPQVMMNKPLRLGLAQAAMATCYATGSPLRIPWDAYMDNGPDGKPAPRYFGQTEDWLPLYRVVADHPTLFDDFHTAATIGIVLNADEPVYEPLRALCIDLTERQIPFRLLGAVSRTARVALDSDRLAETPWLVNLSPIESYAAEDQAAIETALATRRCRLVSLAEAIEHAARPIKVEAPQGVYAFTRLANDGRTVVHLVNWNADAAKVDGDGSGAEPFANVSFAVERPEGWPGKLTATCYAPGEPPVTLAAEEHAGSWRFTVPRLGVWAIVELRVSDPGSA